MKSVDGYWNYHLQSILAQNPEQGPINLTQGTYLNTPQEYFQQFSENVTVTFRPHSHSKFCRICKSLARYWNYHLQSILAQNPDYVLINLILVSYINIPQEYFQQFSIKFTIKFRLQSQSKFSRIFKSIVGYWNYQLESILAQNTDHGLINLIKVTYLHTPQEYFQQFSENFTITFRPNSQSNFCRIFKSLAGYWNYYLQSILAQNPDHGPR